MSEKKTKTKLTRQVKLWVGQLAAIAGLLFGTDVPQEIEVYVVSAIIGVYSLVDWLNSKFFEDESDLRKK